MNQDWTGNAISSSAVVGARHIAKEDRANRDYYATEPKAVELLLNEEKFSPWIWEPACGEGHISKELTKAGYKVISTDIVYRGFGAEISVDFLQTNEKFAGDIITNPPYKYAKDFVEKAMEIVDDGHKVAMFLRLLFLESKARKAMFKKYPPKVIYVSTSRLHCARNGDFENAARSNAICYAWFVWEKGFKGEPIIRWVG